MDHRTIYIVTGRKERVYEFHNYLEVPQSLKENLSKPFKCFGLILQFLLSEENFSEVLARLKSSFFFHQGEHLSPNENQSCHKTGVVIWRLVWDNVKLAFGFCSKRQPSSGDQLSVCLIYACDLIIYSTKKLFLLRGHEGCTLRPPPILHGNWESLNMNDTICIFLESNGVWGFFSISFCHMLKVTIILHLL